MTYRLAYALGVMAAIATLPVGCEGDGANDVNTSPVANVDETDLGTPEDCVPGAPVPEAHHYAAKVKMLINGLPLTAAELDAIRSDPATLRDHIDTWLDTPEASRKLVTFFQRAFQQNRVNIDDLDENLGATNFAGWGRVQEYRFIDLVMENMRESFARTALAITEEGRPFTDVLTTRAFMMTTGLMATLSFYADRPDQDDGKDAYRLLDAYLPEGVLVWERDEVIPPEQTLDPSHPNFMHFSDAVFADCLDNPQYVFTGDVPRAAWQSLTGSYWLTGPVTGISGDNCKNLFQNNQSLLSIDDFQDWHWVTVREPEAGEEHTMFWELDHMRAGGDFVTDAPYVGFFTTPAFWSTWPTNSDNDARVTMNQALIVAFGRSFDGEANIAPASVEGLLDGDHANPETECYSCHKTLDPMRQLVRQSMTYGGHRQLDTDVSSVSGVFAFDGVEQEGDGVDDLALFMSEHPAFPSAWVQKLCYYANSAPCPPTSPLFQDMVDAFVASDYDFRSLITELFASPLVTSAACVDGGSGNAPSINRQQHLCDAMRSRLGLDDLCEMEYFGGEDQPLDYQREITQVIGMIPADDYARGAETPLTISESSLFIASAYEAICREDCVGAGGPGRCRVQCREHDDVHGRAGERPALRRASHGTHRTPCGGRGRSG